ncbi:MAG: hypothetical protein HY795_07130 [Desulfovibrio sp.]|nr:hypothetical protein [Desulfovibrio sp.]MBI4960734.1 hypothetical protein [Desulfovibrio sp.]
MSTAILHFHGELAPLTGGERLDYRVTRRASLKDVLEAVGVPHTEVYFLTVDGQPVHFRHILVPGDEVSVHPGEPPVNVTCDHPLRSALPSPHFIADANVGRLSTYLRLMGLDVAYNRCLSDDDVALTAAREGRVVLTRDHGLLRRKTVEWGRLVRANDPIEQTRDIVRFFGLAPLAAPFSRCVRCNRALASVPKSAVLHVLQPKTKLYYEAFSQCPSCGRVYWAGSHHDRMREMLRKLRDTP